MNAAFRGFVTLALLALVTGAGIAREAGAVRLGTPAGLGATYFAPVAGSAVPHPAVVFMHGCGGPYGRDGAVAARFRSWAQQFNAQGYAVLLVDSFSGRGLRELCTQPFARRSLRAVDRVPDAWAARAWLIARGDVDPARIALMGWSHGATTTLFALRRTPEGGKAFAAAVAVYPGCSALAKAGPYRPQSPVLLLIGEADDWTPASPCRDLADEAPEIVLKTYPGAFHGFDEPFGRLRVRTDVPNGVRPGRGVTVGPDVAAREDALRRVSRFLAERFA